ncbi:hypothetical protein N657DRAFT_480250 [Parathielavia appendiculata]|uniref:Uncharacterized protein n=1 Tax=Parathielavia appendiculata TaxID=2587402 RepID=A0AAN6TXY9_9PEZI|nr:hypothetical protein N657DRAFT_480250 [Parathielavia appendiculata]
MGSFEVHRSQPAPKAFYRHIAGCMCKGGGAVTASAIQNGQTARAKIRRRQRLTCESPSWRRCNALNFSVSRFGGVRPFQSDCSGTSWRGCLMPLDAFGQRDAWRSGSFGQSTQISTCALSYVPNNVLYEADGAVSNRRVYCCFPIARPGTKVVDQKSQVVSSS